MELGEKTADMPHTKCVNNSSENQRSQKFSFFLKKKQLYKMNLHGMKKSHLNKKETRRHRGKGFKKNILRSCKGGHDCI